MSILNILTYPDPFLKTKAKPVGDISDSVKRLIEDMVETMYFAKGIGLTSTQVGDDRRVIVLDVPNGDEYRRGRNLLALINPEIINHEGETSFEEGCLSVPGITAEVERSARITLKALNIDGKDLEISAEGLLAIVIQHEVDHLDGILFIDRLSRIKRGIMKRKIKKAIEDERKRL
jgi:peptide deformylase